MATNYEILMSLSRKQMSSFIRSLVTKDASKYIDWASWLNSEDPEPSYIGKPAFTRDGEGERACYLLEETDDNGKIVRTIYTLLDKGEVRKETLPVYLVRTADEETYQPAPLPEISEEAIDEAVIAQEEIVEELLSEAEAENTIPEMTIDEIISEPEPGEASKKIEDMIAQEVQEPQTAMDEDADISDKITAALIESEEGIVDEHIDLEATTELPVFSQEVLNEINGEQPEEEPAAVQNELNLAGIDRALSEEDDALMETAELSILTEETASQEKEGLSDDLIDELLLLEAAQFMDDDYFVSEKTAEKQLPEEETAGEDLDTVAEAEEETAEDIQEETAEEIAEPEESEEELTPEEQEVSEEETEPEEVTEEIQEEETEESVEESAAEEAETEAGLTEEDLLSEPEEETEEPAEEEPLNEEVPEEKEEAEQPQEEPEETPEEELTFDTEEEETAEEADQMIVDEIELPEEILAEIGAAEAVLSGEAEETETLEEPAEEPVVEAAETAVEEPQEFIHLSDEEEEELPDIILDLDQPKKEEKEEPEWSLDDLFDEDLMKQLDDAVNAADQAESEMTASLRFDELQQKEEPVKEKAADGEEDDDVYFFSKGRIELLKEQLFDEDEPPAGKDDLLFKETTAIEFVADKDGNEIRSGKDDISVNELPQSKAADLEESQKIASFFDSVNQKEAAEQPQEEKAAEAEPEKEPEEDEVEFVFEDPRSAELQRFLEDVKHRSMLFDPDDPEDLELPTIAFSAMADEKENYF